MARAVDAAVAPLEHGSRRSIAVLAHAAETRGEISCVFFVEACIDIEYAFYPWSGRAGDAVGQAHGKSHTPLTGDSAGIKSANGTGLRLLVD